MKKLLIFIVLFSLCALAFSKAIDETKAKLVGQHFLASRTAAPSFKTGVTLELSYLAKSSANSPMASMQAINYYYVFNVSNGNGFVIVSADDNVIPVLGYSDEADFNPNDIPINAKKWLDAYKGEIRDIILNAVSQTLEIKNEWNDLTEGNTPNGSVGKKSAVSPLMQTKWNQRPNYNALCPYDNALADRAVTGCVATAMAQVMKYWNYPSTGTGSHSYNHSKFGTLSANFGATTYNWSSMPNTLTGANSSVATLMYHCGVSVDMGYGVESSGAYVISAQSPVTHCSEYALKTYFGYKSTLRGVERSSYSQAQWIALLKGEVDASRPILHAGFGGGGGHCFVADGYDNNSFFHFNWGWGGQEDGYFTVNALNPGSLGAGGGTGGYNSDQQVIIGIEPPTSTQTYDMRLYTAMTINPNPIEYGSGFSVTVDVANFGASAANNFAGDYAAAIFNASNQFVSYIETKTGYTLNFNSHYTSPLVFTTSSIPALTPGTYTIGIYYKPTGASTWTAFANGSYQNFKSVDVKGNDQNPLKLYAAITTSPSIITRNQAFTVNFDIANFATSTFNGDVSVDIHKSDGTWIRELSIKNGLSLPSNTHFTNGLSYTITGGIADSAGSYQFFVWDKPTGGNWEFVGSGTFANPIVVQVKDPSLTPDVFEPNNTQNAAFNMPISFTGNTAVKNSSGSNIHLGNDYDYYKIALPAGYNYSITSRIHDSYNSGNSQVYTVDGLVSYSTDGTTWSDAFDDIISGNILVNGGGTLYFMVSPYFTGSTGTYLLEATVTRNPVSSAAKEITAFTTNGIVGSAIINSSAATVKLNVTYPTDITALAPIISVSSFASINPASGVAQDFTNPVVYTVTAQDASIKQWTVTVTKPATGLDDISLDETIKIFPNPAKDELNIDLSVFKGKVIGVSLLDVQGKKVEARFDPSNSKMLLSNLKEGFYILHVETDNGVVNKKILIQP